MRVIDGVHRLHAARLRRQREIAVRFFNGTKADAFLRAVEENVSHGLPLSLRERRAAARRIIDSHPQLSDRSIAASSGLADKTVAGLRRSSTAEMPHLSARMGADGRLHPLNVSEGRLRAAEIIAARPDTPLREVARGAGVSVGTAHDVRIRLRRGDGPVPPQQRSHPPGTHAPARPAPPGSGELPPAPGPQAAAEARDSKSILQSLMKDPSIRHTSTGRDLLRWLWIHIITADDGADLIEAVPPHCAELIAGLAHQCANAWSQFANDAQRRARAGPAVTDTPSPLGPSPIGHGLPRSSASTLCE
jgi:ParB-like chromosome segregation protein Spo0J